MMRLQPRDYQQEGINAAYRDLYTRGFGGTIAHLATGLGKTFMIACYIKQHIDLHTQRVMFCVHRQDLIIQTYYEFIEAFPEWTVNIYTMYGRRGIGIVMGSQYNHIDARIIIGTPQTLSSVEGTSHRLDEILNFGLIDLLIIDEAHYGASQSYLQLASHLAATNPASKRIGLTATPMRSDGITLRHPLNDGLGNLFDTICISRNIRWGIDQGYLAPIRPPLLISTNIDLPEGKGSYEERAKLIDVGNWAELYVKGYVDHGEGRLGAHFLPTVKHSKTIWQAFTDAGIKAIHVDGEGLITPEGDEIFGKEAFNMRRSLYRRAAEENIQLCNYDVIGHGFNLPRIDLIGLGQPTDSQVRVTQQIGRGTRLHKDKKDLLVLDYALKGVPLLLSGNLLGFTWDEKRGEMVEDEEVVVEELSNDLRDEKQEGELVNADGIVVRVGNLFREKAEAWFYSGNNCSLSLSTEDILYINTPNYSLGLKILDGIEAGRQWLLDHPDDKSSKEFYDNLVETYKLMNNYTLWHLHKDSRGWFVSLGRSVAAAPSVELVFDYAIPIISRFEVPVLTNKKQPWRGKKIPPTESQLAFLRSMNYNGIPENKGEASKVISHVIAQRNVDRIINERLVNCRKYGEI